jgi:hypothetical protein
MTRTMMIVEFPIAKTINEAIKFMEAGGEVWQEISDDFPCCTGFDDVECLIENFPEDDYDEGYDEDIQSYYLHLVPADASGVKEAKPFAVGERVWSMERIFPTNDIYLLNGDCRKITEISPDGSQIKITHKTGGDLWWDADKFCRCVLPVAIEKVYILNDLEETSFFGSCEHQSIYKNLDFLKFECGLGILWSDEYDGDVEEELEKLGVLGNYSGSNWDIEGIDTKTGKLLYGVAFSEIRVEYS